MKDQKVKKEKVKAKVGDHFYLIAQTFLVTSVKGDKITAKIYPSEKGSK